MSQPCTATTKAGEPCRAWAVAESDPPRCSAHARVLTASVRSGGKKPVGAPAGNQNAVKHGLYRSRHWRGAPAPGHVQPAGSIETIDDALAHLAESLQQLAEYIRQRKEDLDVDDMARLSSVRGQNLSRYVRMLKDKAALHPEADHLSDEIHQALQLAAETLGVDL